MAWQDEVIESVRILIGDLADTPTYTDDRIERVAVTSAQQMVNEITFPVTYTVSIPNSTIVPDPTTAPRDEAFIWLLSLKAASLIMVGESRTYAISSMKITDGPSSVDTGAAYTNVKSLADSLSARYDKAKIDYITGVLVPGAAILTPTTQDAIVGGFIDTTPVGRFNYQNR